MMSYLIINEFFLSLTIPFTSGLSVTESCKLDVRYFQTVVNLIVVINGTQKFSNLITQITFEWQLLNNKAACT